MSYESKVVKAGPTVESVWQTLIIGTCILVGMALIRCSDSQDFKSCIDKVADPAACDKASRWP